MRDLAYKALTAREELTVKNGKEPNVDEIAKHLDVTSFEVSQALDAISDPVSIYEPVYSSNGDTICLLEQIKDTRNNEDDWIANISLKKAISELENREKEILNKRFYIGRTQTEVAEEIGISQAQVSRLEKTALAKLKKQL